MENKSKKTINQEPPAQQPEDLITSPLKPKKAFPKKPLLVIGFLILVIIFSLSYYLLRRNIAPTSNIQNQITKTKPTPALKAPDPTANWKTFTNTNLGLSLKYPPDWRVDQEAHTATISISNNDCIKLKQHCANITIYEYQISNFKGTSAKDYFNYSHPENLGTIYTNIGDKAIGDLTGYLTYQDMPSWDGRAVSEIITVLIDKRPYIISISEKESDGHYINSIKKYQFISIFDQILSTFTFGKLSTGKFTDQSTPTPTCRPRPACLDATPRCLIPETSDMCPKPTPVSNAASAPIKSDSQCKIGGCSGEICQDSNTEPLMSTCIYKAEYACYKEAVCEIQTNGHCGWTQTPELLSCLENTK